MTLPHKYENCYNNPLRLALLCRSWSLTQGTLPSTKATLYQQFVETIYEWKQDRFPTTPAQRHQLNQALGQLAVRALAQSDTRFRLPHSFVQQIIELMPLGLQVGWLNQVGISATSGEKVYAFYHPTLAYTCAVFQGQRIKRMGIQKYIGRLTESKRAYRRHSSFWI